VNINSSPTGGARNASQSSLPPSSPPPAFSETEDEGTDREAVANLDSEDEGEDLFGDGLLEKCASYRYTDYWDLAHMNLNLFSSDCRDYEDAIDPRLDAYDNDDLDDEGEFEEMDADTRRAAEQHMARRDRAERGGRRGARAARRQPMPGFMMSEDDMDEDGPDGGLLTGMRRRTRRQYDERKLDDDAEGLAEDVSVKFGSN